MGFINSYYFYMILFMNVHIYITVVLLYHLFIFLPLFLHNCNIYPYIYLGDPMKANIHIKAHFLIFQVTILLLLPSGERLISISKLLSLVTETLGLIFLSKHGSEAYFDIITRGNSDINIED